MTIAHRTTGGARAERIGAYVAARARMWALWAELDRLPPLPMPTLTMRGPNRPVWAFPDIPDPDGALRELYARVDAATVDRNAAARGVVSRRARRTSGRVWAAILTGDPLDDPIGLAPFSAASTVRHLPGRLAEYAAMRPTAAPLVVVLRVLRVLGLAPAVDMTPPTSSADGRDPDPPPRRQAPTAPLAPRAPAASGRARVQ